MEGQLAVEKTQVNIASPEMQEDESVVKKGQSSYTFTFTCTKCKRTVCVSSDLYSKIEDKKAQHICDLSNIPFKQK